jgi:hypothetical protein
LHSAGGIVTGGIIIGVGAVDEGTLFDDGTVTGELLTWGEFFPRVLAATIEDIQRVRTMNRKI